MRMLVRPTRKKRYTPWNNNDMQAGIVLLTDSGDIFRFGRWCGHTVNLTIPFEIHPCSTVQNTQSTTKSTFTLLHKLHQPYWILAKDCPAQHHTSAWLQSIAHVEKNINSVMCSSVSPFTAACSSLVAHFQEQAFTFLIHLLPLAEGWGQSHGWFVPFYDVDILEDLFHHHIGSWIRSLNTPL